MIPPARYHDPRGYRYYQTSVREGGVRKRPTIKEHQLVFLLHEQCDDPECDCSCHPECESECVFACPYKVFSNGEWQIHHGREDGRLPPCTKKWANWMDNLIIMRDDDHARVTRELQG